MKEEPPTEIVEALRQIITEITDTQLKGPLIGMEEAAKYTGRSCKTFRNEFHRGIWTPVKVSAGHPKFSKKDLDKDMEPWTQYSKFRKHEGRRRN